MPDISICRTHNCPKKEECYRYNAIPNRFLQSYFNPEPIVEGKFDCGYFIPMKEDED